MKEYVPGTVHETWTVEEAGFAVRVVAPEVDDKVKKEQLTFKEVHVAVDAGELKVALNYCILLSNVEWCKWGYLLTGNKGLRVKLI